jgi:hypothetical protein
MNSNKVLYKHYKRGNMHYEHPIKGKGHHITSHEDTGGVEVYHYSFFNVGARWGWVINATPRSLNPQERPVLIVYEAECNPGSVQTGAERLASLRFDLRTIQA